MKSPLLILLAFLLSSTLSVLTAEPPVDLGSKRELFVDEYLIDSMEGVALKLHKPQAQDVALVCDAPWEGNTSAYFTLFQDGDIYRAYYRGSHFDEATKKAAHAETACYAESRDGITWTKPKLGLVEFNGSKENNIVLIGEGCHNFSPFKDTRPDCPPESRYKALGRARGLCAWQSADGLRWTRVRRESVITAGAFDSQNLAFYDTELGAYRAYWRFFTGGVPDERGKKSPRVRAIRTATSKDFLSWENQADLRYGDAPEEQLYTNAVQPYARAPHLLIGFPTRYEPKLEQVEPILMMSRDGTHFKRWAEPVIPITAPKDRDGNRSNYMTLGLLQLPGSDRELSVYGTEAYYKGPASRVRRFTYRVDGFVSASAVDKGLLITKPFNFTGAKLSLNVASKGATRAEIQDAGGKAIPGFTLDDCAPIQGDFVNQVVTWKGGNLSDLVGQVVRLHFELREADLFALQFTP
jgi:hypothetical protein